MLSGSAKLSVWPVLVGAGVLGWAYWPTLEFLFDKWSTDPQYSHGFLVPLFSAYLLWKSNKSGAFANPVPASLLGGGILALTVGGRWLAGGLLFHQLDAAAMLVSLIGLAFALGGWKWTRPALPAVLFLAFAVPLPYEIERNVGGPLKDIATASSTYLLQTLGLPAIAEGHIILIDEVRLGVVDACSGLKMLMTFAAFAAGAIITLSRTRFEKFLIALGVVPIAVVTNVLRITATGVAHSFLHEKATTEFLHDLHGWLMMPVGLGFLGFQLWCLTRLVVRERSRIEPLVPLAAV